jgi:hypothetical protein
MEDVIERDEEGEMNQFIFESLIKFGGGITIESSAILMFDKMLGYEGFYPFNNPPEYPDKMDYLNSAYFVIVSFSTIGYGDIFPIKTVIATPYPIVIQAGYRLYVCLQHHGHE